MKKITSYILRYWYAYLFAILCMVISISLDMLSPQITRRIIDDVIIGGNNSLLTKLLIGILFVGVGRCIFQYLKEYTFDIVSTKITCEMRKNLFNHIQSLSIRFFDKNNTGELMARVKDDIDNIWRSLGFIGMLMIEVTIHTTIVIYCMYRISPKLSLIPLIAMPLVAIMAIFMERKLGKVYEEISEENALLNTVAEENLAGVRTVKAFAREKFEIKKFLSHNKKYYDLNMQQAKILTKNQPNIQFITKLLPISIIIFGGYLVMKEEITLGSLGAFVEYSMNIVWPMEMLGWLTNDFSSAVASSKKLHKIYNESSEIIEKENAISLSEVQGEIIFDHVTFKHGDNEILSDINFHLNAGKTLGIMGATGSGKTSIISLLQRFYDADDGNIILDGNNIKEINLKDLRSNISLVMQDNFLFSDTIIENIKLGKKEYVDHDTVISAAGNAMARDFIERMEKQYDTIIGERGVGLSGGQKQRISIARALAKKTPILIMDDSTSALDTETEHMIQKSLEDLSGTTKIIIAHRISAVKQADEIIVLDEGKIAERGTHESLLSKKGLYYKTYIAQYKEFMKEGSLCL
ncbi:ATP-binding cassette subfamily B protein [Mobilisporobacter senegalensis]|uniref:ATP-binding cassette subfamily B protein n=1 Tax=Mobilisporobacter senegalensis TaxID=1329262 RepID=A0A3N1X4Q9_9FIRM|nr:ABC transporter ATP-binding protein [Mobilisporobacter senegalensis]ROR21753.1 ATP-binding cassette subfamily B protein [Mobilisporobacter senegalensis]